MATDEKDEAKDGTSITDSEKEVLQAAVDGHQKVTLRALDVIPRNERLTVYILWTISLLALVAGVIFGLAVDSTYGFIIILVAFLCILGSIFLQSRKTSATPEQFGELVRGQVSAPTWARMVPKLPISDEKLDAFQLSIRQLRTNAVTLFNEARTKAGRSEVSDEKIRINIFLVLTYETQKSGALVLVIPKRIHDNMSNYDDRKIRILPHEGLTGRTFTFGEACGAMSTLKSTDKLEWSKVDLFPTRPTRSESGRFTLSEEQQKLIGTRLRWVVSFPLYYDAKDRDTTFGVLNIDCLDDTAEVEDLRALASAIEPFILDFAERIAELPKVRITIRVEDSEN